MFNKVFKEYIKSMECKLDNFIPAENTSYSLVTDAMRYSLLNAGKRIRPIILLEFYKICGGKADGVYNFAAALEMIHTYSLIHDDLPCMDNDDMRRGKPSNHIKYGEDIALLAGDGLLTQAFYTASSVCDIEPKNVLKAVNALASRAGYSGMIGGQVIDLQSEGKQVDIKLIEQLNLLKTGALLQCAAEVGCILAGADENKCSTARRYGRFVGLAFQIIDDILDATSDTATLGKPVGSDDKNDKSTFVYVYGIEKCKQIAADLTDKALDCLNEFDGDVSFLKELTNFLLNREF